MACTYCGTDFEEAGLEECPNCDPPEEALPLVEPRISSDLAGLARWTRGC